MGMYALKDMSRYLIVGMNAVSKVLDIYSTNPKCTESQCKHSHFTHPHVVF